MAAPVAESPAIFSSYILAPPQRDTIVLLCMYSTVYTLHVSARGAEAIKKKRQDKHRAREREERERLPVHTRPVPSIPTRQATTLCRRAPSFDSTQ